MKNTLSVAIVLALLALPAFADSAANIPATPPSWAVFIRGGLVAAGLFIAANIAGRLWIAWRQRQAERRKD
jgi:hypothetical protein